MRIKAFDGWKSLIHVFLGFVTGLITIPDIKLLIITLFITYEAMELINDRDLGSFTGDILEFMTGIALAKAVINL
jgi:hypothetical protein